MDSDTHFKTLLQQTPGEYHQSLVHDYEAIREIYPVHLHQMPQPAWATNGWTDSNQDAWARLQQLADQSSAPLSVYVHTPFCRSKCGFCDCLSAALDDDHLMAKFCQVLNHEIKLWGADTHLKDRPVTVLYFGGGTPNLIPDVDFLEILHTLTGSFAITTKTQISVECNESLLSPDKLRFLISAGVNRLSIGIQTLEEPLRNRLGRKTTAEEVLSTVCRCREMGFITCGDLIYGLPEQTIAGFIGGLFKLIDAGIDGLSIYRFHISPRNRSFVNEQFTGFQRDEMLNYLLLNIADQILSSAEYRKNHFVHYARQDDNLYYRHMLRGEDLIALGPTADGIIGDYRYRHGDLEDYLKDHPRQYPALEGGLWESKAALNIKPATVQLMCGGIDDAVTEKLRIDKLIEKWQRCRMIEPTEQGRYRLAANGSWFIHQLIEELDQTMNDRFKK